MCVSLIQGGGGSCLFLEIIRPMLVLFVHINILFVKQHNHTTLVNMYSIHLVVLIESSTCPHGGGIVMTK